VHQRNGASECWWHLRTLPQRFRHLSSLRHDLCHDGTVLQHDRSALHACHPV